MAKKVSFFVHNLGDNCIVRAAPFARAFLLMGWKVEILGFSYSYNPQLIYPPYKDEFGFKVVKVPNDIRWVILSSLKLARMAEGEVIYAFKPKWTTLLPAILASWFGWKKRLIMDAEDNELWDSYIGNGARDFLRHPWYVENPVWNKILHPATWFIRSKTVVCESLKKRYGGSIVLHGPINSAIKDVSDEEVLQNKLELALPTDMKIVLFAGRPTNYNGVIQIAGILKNAVLQDYIFVLAGDPQNSYFIEAKKILGERCFLLGQISNTRISKLIVCADVILILQVINKNTEMQIPAKFIEALAYGIPTIVSNVCDLGKIVSTFYSGDQLVITNTHSIESALKLTMMPGFKRKYGIDSKKFYNQNASIERIMDIVKVHVSN
jgi:glycosyltransferase involved in cell wall biosynthesis